ncbi:MAG: DUF1460 domain-containing protein [Elusimicrobia bacterium]|nr:DUF1460 domain-containing protein [Elusimicrobiota bacterium]
MFHGIKSLNFNIRSLLLAAFTALPLPVFADEPPAYQPPSGQEIAQIINEARQKHPNDVNLRIAMISERFLGMPYQLGPLGEGPEGEFDRDPMLRFDCADCTTFIETVMSMALAPQSSAMDSVLQRIRYKDARVFYRARNHFPEADWIPNNAQAGFLKDITNKIGGESVAWESKTISKQKWYVAKSTNDLQGFDHLSAKQKRRLADKWKKTGRALPDETARIPYIPASELPGKAKQIPTGSIFNVVRENREDQMVLITHQGLIIQKPDGAYVRHAAWGRTVEEQALDAYINKYNGARWKVLGMNFNAVLDPR